MVTLEENLIEQLQRGDNDAYRELYAKFYGVLCVVAERYLHDRFLAECVVENVIFNIWEKRGQLAIRSSLRSYLTMSVRNAALNYLRSKYMRNETMLSQLSEADRHWIETATTHDLPTDAMVTDDTMTQILECLGSEECRQVFIRSRFESMSYQEIADDLDISVNTVKYHMKNALARLAKAYNSYFMFVVVTSSCQLLVSDFLQMPCKDITVAL